MRFTTSTALAALLLFAVTAEAQAAVAVVTPGQGSLTDAAGDTWIITANGAIREILADGSAIWTPGGGGTAALAIVNGTVYGEDAYGRGWFDLSGNGRYWVSTPEPAGVAMPVIAATATPVATAATAASPTTTTTTTPTATANTTTAATTDPCTGVSAGGFNVVNGKLIGPNGQPFIAHGIDIYASDMSSVLATILTMFPGLNMVRVYDAGYEPPSAYTSFVQTLTSKGIVVAIVGQDNGTSCECGGGQGVAFTGQQLLNQQAWLQSLAATFANNPYVWYGPNNEPPATGLSTWDQESYNTIRSAGNNNIIMFDLPGGGYPGNTIAAYGMDASLFAQMTNVILDPHFYGWAANFSTDQGTVSAAVQSLLSAAQLQTADGIAPEIIGEFGNSTTAPNVDPNWQQVVTAVETDGAGSTAFAWNGGGGSGADVLVQNGSLTQYGAMVAGYIAQGGGVAGAAVASATTACPSLASTPSALAAANTAAVISAATGTPQPGGTSLDLTISQATDADSTQAAPTAAADTAATTAASTAAAAAQQAATVSQAIATAQQAQDLEDSSAAQEQQAVDQGNAGLAAAQSLLQGVH